MNNKSIKKVRTDYALGNNYVLIKNEEVEDNYSIVEFGEPCSGILKHWGSKQRLISELENIIKFLTSMK